MNLINFDTFSGIINELSNDYANIEEIIDEIVNLALFYYNGDSNFVVKYFGYEFYFTVIDGDIIQYNFYFKEDKENE